MVNRCNAVNVSIIVDAVINHMAAGSSGIGMAGSTYTTRTFPDIYTPDHFHHYDFSTTSNCQVTDYSNKDNVQKCDLVGLPDLVTGNEYVQQTIADYINYLSDLGVKGIRIDAAKHQDSLELNGIISKINDKSFYIGQEVIGSSGEAVQPYMYSNNGQVSEFYYSDYLCYNIINQYKMFYLQNIGEDWGLIDDTYSVVFIDKSVYINYYYYYFSK